MSVPLRLRGLDPDAKGDPSAVAEGSLAHASEADSLRPRPAVFALVFLVAFDLPASQLLHAALASHIGDWYLLFLPAVVAAAVLYLAEPSAVCASPPALKLWAIAGALTLVAGATSGEQLLATSIRDASLGFIVSAVLVTILQTRASAAWSLRALLWGWCAYLAIGIFFAIAAVADSYLGESPWVNLPMLEKAKYFRYEMLRSGNPYALWFGNSNKASNILLLAFGVFACMNLAGLPCFRSRRATWCFVALTSIHVIATSSRLVLLVFPALLIAWAIMAPVDAQRTQRDRWISVALIVMFLVALLPLYLIIFTTEQDGGVLATLASKGGRVDQLVEIARVIADRPADLVLGFGSGWYGTMRFGSAEAETHNFVVDRLLASGIGGACAVVGAWLCALASAIRATGAARVMLLMLIGSMLLCWIREFSAAYLFRTSLGGVVACVVLSMPQFVSASRRPT